MQKKIILLAEACGPSDNRVGYRESVSNYQIRMWFVSALPKLSIVDSWKCQSYM